MKASCVLLVLCLFLAGHGQAAQEKPIMKIVPSLAELGADWTTNEIVSLLDPLSRRSQIGPKGPPDGTGMTNLPSATPKGRGQAGWGRFHFGRGDMVIDHGAYFVTIQRWGSTNALDKAWKGWKAAPDRSARLAPPVGEGAFWTEDDKFHGLTFRRGFFHVVITCGAKSDHSGIIRLAEVIDAKITGRPVPKADKD